MLTVHWRLSIHSCNFEVIRAYFEMAKLSETIATKPKHCCWKRGRFFGLPGIHIRLNTIVI